MNPNTVVEALREADELQRKIVEGLPTGTPLHPPLKPWQAAAFAESQRRLEALK